jgi:hypothetical protein
MALVDDEDSARLAVDYDVDVSTLRNMCGKRAILKGSTPTVASWEN